jgi:hypothetical protein
MKTKFLLSYKPISIRKLSAMVDTETMKTITKMYCGATCLVTVNGTLEIVKRVSE